MNALVRGTALGFELAGIAAMVIGTLVAGVHYVRLPEYDVLRKHIARSILLGLELLIAADIIGTITVRPTLTSVLVLAIIVLIRTLLSFTLELEVTGRFPWQRERKSPTAKEEIAGG